jgi:transposase
MRTKGSPRELESRRLLAVWRVLGGYSVGSVARFFGVSRLSIRRWMRAYAHGGWQRLRAVPAPGRPSTLNGRHKRMVLAWLKHSATDFGFATERWTAPRVARLLAERLQIHLHPRYVSRWLKRHGVTPQVPAKVPIERDDQLIRQWVAVDWPRIKKKPRN